MGLSGSAARLYQNTHVLSPNPLMDQNFQGGEEQLHFENEATQVILVNS